MAAIPHIANRRGGVWYFERRVPSVVLEQPEYWKSLFGGKKLWRKSLKTRDRIEALERGLEAAREFDDLLSRCLGRQKPSFQSPPVATSSEPTLSEEVKVITRDEYRLIALDEHERIIRPWRLASVRADSGADRAIAFELDAERYKKTNEETVRCIKRRGYENEDPSFPPSPLTRAKQINLERRFFMPVDSDRFGVLVGAVREGFLAANRETLALIDGALVAPEVASSLIKDARRINEALRRRSPTLSVVVATYITKGGSKGRLKSRTEIGIRQALREFIEEVGDQPLDKIERRDVQRFLSVLGKKSIGGRSNGSIERLASPSTVRKKLTFLRSSVAMAIAHDEFDGANPFSDINLGGLVQSPDRAIMVEKRAFEASELNALFRHPWLSSCAGPDDKSSYLPGDHRLHDVRFWGPVLALYTGCRAAELGGLKLNEVRLDDPHPHFVIQPNSYRGTKNSKTRRVPILDALVSLGFKMYVEQIRLTGSDRLFPDWTPAAGSAGTGAKDERWAAAKWPRAFNRTVIPAALAEFLVDGTRRGVTLHSFRGSFKRMLEDARVPQQFVDDIIGHAKNDLDQRYSGQRGIEILYEATHSLNYNNLKVRDF